MGRLVSRAGSQARLQVNTLEDRCTPSATVLDARLVGSISINDGAASWESVTSIQIEFTRRMDFEAKTDIRLMEASRGGSAWTEVPVPNVQSWLNSSGISIVRMIGPSAGDAIVVDGDYKIVLTATNYGAQIDLGSFHGVDLGDAGDGDSEDDGPWH